MARIANPPASEDAAVMLLFAFARIERGAFEQVR
jgi:hypothetical protein